MKALPTVLIVVGAILAVAALAGAHSDGVGASGYACGYADAMSKAAYGHITEFDFCAPFREAAAKRNFP